MNIYDPRAEELLRTLLASVDDASGNHVLWIDRFGDAHLTAVGDRSGAALQQEEPSMKVRFETYFKRRDYVGAQAANDRAYVVALLKSLRKAWEERSEGDGVDYVD